MLPAVLLATGIWWGITQNATAKSATCQNTILQFQYRTEEWDVPLKARG